MTGECFPELVKGIEGAAQAGIARKWIEVNARLGECD
jgi:hypothetical protein